MAFIMAPVFSLFSREPCERRTVTWRDAGNSTEHAAGGCARSGTLRRLRMLLVSEITSPRLVREQHRNVVVRKARSASILHDARCLSLRLRNTKHRLIRHVFLLKSKPVRA